MKLKLKTVLRVVFAFISAILATLSIVVTVILIFGASELSFSFYSWIVYDDSGEIIAEMTPLTDPVYKREIALSEVPQVCTDMLLISEDRNFYSHPGVDLAGVLRKARELVFGGSSGSATIHQQLLKISEQTAGNNLINQFADAVQAVRINMSLPKDEVLELYWNHIYLGQFNYGIEAAANDYFDKPAEELTKLECAFMVAIISSPNSYNPYINQRESVLRTEFMLDLFARVGYLSSTERELLDATELKFELAGQPMFTRTQLECLAMKLTQTESKLDRDLEIYTNITNPTQLDSCEYDISRLN